MVRRSLSLTMLVLLGVSALVVAGCGSGGSGMGFLDPFQTGTHTPIVNPSHSPDPSPSASPTVDDYVMVSNLMNPSRTCRVGDNMWTVNGFNMSAAGTNGLVRYNRDTKNNESENDPLSPQQMKIMLDGSETALVGPSWIAGYAGDDGDILVIADGFNTGNCRVLMLTPEVDANGNWKEEVDAILIGKDSGVQIGSPLAVDIDHNFIWITDNAGGRLLRAEYNGKTVPELKEYISGGLYSPAGVKSNGGYVAVAENGGSSVYVAPTRPEDSNVELPVPITGWAKAARLQASSGDPAVSRPYDVAWAGNNHLFVTEGLEPLSSGATAGVGRIRMWYGPGNNNEAIENKSLTMVESGLTGPAGLTVVYDAVADASAKRADIAFACIDGGASANGGQIMFRALDLSRDTYGEVTIINKDKSKAVKSELRPVNDVLVMQQVVSPELVGGVNVHVDPPTTLDLVYNQGYLDGIVAGSISRKLVAYPEVND